MHSVRFWLPALSGMVFLGLSAGLIGIYGFFVEPLSREFGVSVARISLGPVVLLLAPGLLSPLVGQLTDRLPIRWLILAGVSLSMGSLIAVSVAPSLTLAVLGFFCFAVGLVLYGPVVVNALMVKLYPGREARASAFAAIGISLATALLPPVTGLLLAAFGWRAGLAGLAAGIFVLVGLVALFAVPAGAVGATLPLNAPAQRPYLREPAFWLIGLCVALGLNVFIVLAVCYPLHLEQRGFSVAQAGWFMSVAGLAGLCGKLLVAWLGDAARHRAKWLAVGIVALQLLGMLALLAAGSAATTVAAMALLGFGGGAFLPMHPFLNSRYFDAAVIGRVSGAQMPLFLPFSLVGAPLAGAVFDRSGSYDAMFVALAAALCVAALLAARLPPATRA